MGDMLSAKQAAQILDCSPDDVLHLRKQGLLRGYRHKVRLWRFRKADVEKLARERHLSPAQPPDGPWKWRSL